MEIGIPISLTLTDNWNWDWLLSGSPPVGLAWKNARALEGLHIAPGGSRGDSLRPPPTGLGRGVEMGLEPHGHLVLFIFGWLGVGCSHLGATRVNWDWFGAQVEACASSLKEGGGGFGDPPPPALPALPGAICRPPM